MYQEARIEDATRGEEDETFLETGISFLSKVVLTSSEEGSKEGLCEDFLIGRQAFAHVGV